MFNIKLFISHLVYLVIEVIILLFIFSILNYYGLVSDALFRFIKLLILIIPILYNSFLIGKKSFLSSFIYGFLINILLFIYTLINSKFYFKNFIYYLIIILISLLVGFISKKKINS